MSDMKCRVPGLKIGCTSFIIPDYYVPAVRECVKYADDISLLLLESGESGEFLPSANEVKELAAIAADAGVSWNVHLPTDAGFLSPQSTRRYIDNIKRTIELTQCLNPHTWVMHVVTDHVPTTVMQPSLTQAQEEAILLALDELIPFLPAPEYLALENLERHPVDFLDSIVENSPFSRCFDIGHVWKEDWDPMPLLHQWWKKIRICHLHGIADRDHKSLHHISADKIDALLHPMWAKGFSAMITLEVFSLSDFQQSHIAMLQSYERFNSQSPR